jgi:hypothetical protein
MADLGEAFNTLKFQKKQFQNIDYFFTQRNLTEDQEYIDKNMNRKTKKIKVNLNFLALNIPTIITTVDTNGQSRDKMLGFDVEIFGDEGYHYKGSITSYQGVVPSLLIQIKNDKKLFVHVNYKLNDDNNNPQSKKFVNFIEVPKRFQLMDDNQSQASIKQNEDDTVDI